MRFIAQVHTPIGRQFHSHFKPALMNILGNITLFLLLNNRIDLMCVCVLFLFWCLLLFQKDLMHRPREFARQTRAHTICSVCCCCYFCFFLRCPLVDTDNHRTRSFSICSSIEKKPRFKPTFQIRTNLFEHSLHLNVYDTHFFLLLYY